MVKLTHVQRDQCTHTHKKIVSPALVAPQPASVWQARPEWDMHNNGIVPWSGNLKRQQLSTVILLITLLAHDRNILEVVVLERVGFSIMLLIWTNVSEVTLKPNESIISVKWNQIKCSGWNKWAWSNIAKNIWFWSDAYIFIFIHFDKWGGIEQMYSDGRIDLIWVRYGT